MRLNVFSLSPLFLPLSPPLSLLSLSHALWLEPQNEKVHRYTKKVQLQTFRIKQPHIFMTLLKEVKWISQMICVSKMYSNNNSFKVV